MSPTIMAGVAARPFQDHFLFASGQGCRTGCLYKTPNFAHGIMADIPSWTIGHVLGHR